MSDFENKYLGSWSVQEWEKLAHQAWADYDAIATSNEDLECPSRPKQGQEPFHETWARIVGPAYEKAKTMGFAGTYQEWCREVKRGGLAKERE